jgi:hydroxymethylbilane synthase
MRRRSLLAEMRSDLVTVEFRGNLDTRLAKVADGVVQAAILAAAGLQRLGIHVDPASCLDPTRWVPAPGQGALAVEALTERADIRELFSTLDHASTRAELDAERAFGLSLEGGCSVPLGCSAIVSGSSITVTGYLGSPDGRSVRETLKGDSATAAAVGVEVAEAILAAGGEAILAEIERKDAPVVEEP